MLIACLLAFFDVVVVVSFKIATTNRDNPPDKDYLIIAIVSLILSEILMIASPNFQCQTLSLVLKGICILGGIYYMIPAEKKINLLDLGESMILIEYAIVTFSILGQMGSMIINLISLYIPKIVFAIWY